MCEHGYNNSPLTTPRNTTFWDQVQQTFSFVKIIPFPLYPCCACKKCPRFVLLALAYQVPHICDPLYLQQSETKNDLGWTQMLTKLSHLKLIRCWCTTTKKLVKTSHGKPRFGPKYTISRHHAWSTIEGGGALLK